MRHKTTRWFRSTLPCNWRSFSTLPISPARWREIELMLSDDPPMVIGQSCAMTFVPRQGVAAFTIGDVILLRTSQLFVADYDFQVYAVLEELTHALLNLADESLAAWIVTFLYSDRVAYRDGFYVPAASFQPHWPPKRKDWAAHYAVKDFDFDVCKRKT